MTINIHFEKIPFNETLTEYILAKLNRLKEMYPRITKSQVSFKHINDAKRSKKVCEIELQIPGTSIFASSRGHNFDLALKETAQEIEKQLEIQNMELIAS